MSSDSAGRFADRPLLSRRRFVQGLAAGGVFASAGFWPRSLWALKSPDEPQILAGTDFDLAIGETPVNFTGRTRPAITVNGSLPAPALRWRQGPSYVRPDQATLQVTVNSNAHFVFGMETGKFCYCEIQENRQTMCRDAGQPRHWLPKGSIAVLR